MKWLKQNLFKLLNIILISCISVYVVFFAIPNAKNYEIYKKNTTTTKIYTIWNVETFEGGSKPRINFLKETAKLIEKENANILFIFRNISPSSFDSELATSCPDIISFGFGVGKTILPQLKPINSTFNVRDELVESGSFNNKVYALPYIVSGYAQIKHSPSSIEIHCGQTGYTKPENICKNIVKQETQYEAYKSFVYNKNAVLYGTARDVFRVSNLNNIGRANANIVPVNTYTDLIQYIGITNNNNICQMFIKYILSTENQVKLTDYNLFSSLHNKIYSSGIYNDMENAILSCKIANVFND